MMKDFVNGLAKYSFKKCLVQISTKYKFLEINFVLLNLKI